MSQNRLSAADWVNHKLLTLNNPLPADDIDFDHLSNCDLLGQRGHKLIKGCAALLSSLKTLKSSKQSEFDLTKISIRLDIPYRRRTLPKVEDIDLSSVVSDIYTPGQLIVFRHSFQPDFARFETHSYPFRLRAIKDEDVKMAIQASRELYAIKSKFAYNLYLVMWVAI